MLEKRFENMFIDKKRFLTLQSTKSIKLIKQVHVCAVPTSSFKSLIFKANQAFKCLLNYKLMENVTYYLTSKSKTNYLNL